LVPSWWFLHQSKMTCQSHLDPQPLGLTVAGARKRNVKMRPKRHRSASIAFPARNSTTGDARYRISRLYVHEARVPGVSGESAGQNRQLQAPRPNTLARRKASRFYHATGRSVILQLEVVEIGDFSLPWRIRADCLDHRQNSRKTSRCAAPVRIS
jgi:hypothetical protein